MRVQDSKVPLSLSQGCERYPLLPSTDPLCNLTVHSFSRACIKAPKATGHLQTLNPEHQLKLCPTRTLGRAVKRGPLCPHTSSVPSRDQPWKSQGYNSGVNASQKRGKPTPQGRREGIGRRRKGTWSKDWGEKKVLLTTCFCHAGQTYPESSEREHKNRGVGGRFCEGAWLDLPPPLLEAMIEQ